MTFRVNPWTNGRVNPWTTGTHSQNLSASAESARSLGIRFGADGRDDPLEKLVKQVARC